MKDLSDHDSWAEFFQIYWRLIFNVARQSGLTEAEAQDVVQETMFSVMKKMPDFKYDPAIGSFKGWLLQLTRWRILDQIRKRGPDILEWVDKSQTARTAAIERVIDENGPDFDRMWEAEWEKNLYTAALERVKLHLDPQKYQIFDFYVKREWPAEKVAQTFNISVNQVYLIKNRVTELLREEVRRLEQSVT